MNLPTLSAKKMSSILDDIILAFDDPGTWSRILQDIARVSGADAAFFYLVDNKEFGAPLASVGASYLVDRGVSEGWFEPARNPRIARVIPIFFDDPTAIVRDVDAFTLSELDEDPFQCELMRGGGYDAFAVGCLGKVHEYLMLISFERFLRRPRFSVTEAERLREVLNGLRTVFSCLLVSSYFASSRLVHILEQLRRPAATLSKSGRVIHMNASLKAATEANELSLNEVSTLITEGQRAKTCNLLVRQKDALRSPRQPTGPYGSRRELIVSQVLRGFNTERTPFDVVDSLLVVHWPLRMRAPKTMKFLQDAFNLTAIEARLVREIMSGKSLLEISKRKKIKYETLRAQLKRIFQKTGAHRQADLVLLLSRTQNL